MFDGVANAADRAHSVAYGIRLLPNCLRRGTLAGAVGRVGPGFHRLTIVLFWWQRKIEQVALPVFQTLNQAGDEEAKSDQEPEAHVESDEQPESETTAVSTEPRIAPLSEGIAVNYRFVQRSQLIVVLLW